MKFFFISMFIFIIITPLIYFLYIFNHLQKIPKIIVSSLSLFSLIVMMLKLFIQPYSSLFFLCTLITQFYIICAFIILILCAFYQFLTKQLHKKFNHQVLIYIGLFSIVFTSMSYYTHFHKKETHYAITIQKESSLEKLTIGMISDVHLGSGTYLQDIENLVSTFNQKQYDLVCLTGDIFDEATPIEMIEPAIKTLSKIKTRYGIFSIDGNHEIYTNLTTDSLYKKYNIHFLNETYVCVDNLFNIVGREDVVASKDISIDKLFTNIDTSLPTIVLDHNPKRYEEIKDIADIQLSGHTHAGQFFPMTLATSLLYDNVYGLIQKNNFSLIVTSGYGSWGFPIRFLTKCEYLDITITFSKK